MCATVTVARLRPYGNPTVCSAMIKKNKKERPITTSGITNGDIETISKNPAPFKFLNRLNHKAHSPPMSTERVAEQAATFTELKKARNNIWFEKSFLYQRREKPVQTLSDVVLLNEKRRTRKIGV